jgi:hypothetical protein
MDEGMSEQIRCQICRHPGEEYCSDTVECNFRARRRLGMPYHVCVECRADDLERIAQAERQRAERLKALPPQPRNAEYDAHLASPEWRRFADEQRVLARYRCERNGCGFLSQEVEVHHIHYRTLGKERPEDVLVLCPGCHYELDALRREKRSELPISVQIAGDRRVVTWGANS